MTVFSVTDAAVLFICAVISAMGLGGGGLAVLYLVTVKGVPQLNAQGINLLLYIPCCLVSVIIYIKKGYVKPKSVLSLVAASALGAAAGSALLGLMKPVILRSLFAVFLIVNGTVSAFSKRTEPDSDDN